MSDISIKTPAYGSYAASVAASVKDGNGQASAVYADGQGNSVPAAIRAPDAADVSMRRFEKMIDHYVPKELPNTRLQIERDEATGLFIYRSVDNETGEVMRQYPADEILRFISYFRESEGLVVDGAV